MRAAAIACILLAGCGGGGGGTSGGQACIELGAGQVPAQAIDIEATLVAVDLDAFDDLGLTLPSFARMQKVGGGPLGGKSDEGRDVVAPAEVIGGPTGIPYLVPDGFGSFLSVVNRGFLSPFAALDMKVFMSLPLEGNCITFDDAAVTPIVGFAGGADPAPLEYRDPGIEGHVLYQLLSPPGKAALLAAIEADARNRVFTVPTIRTVSGQKFLVVVQDVLPQIEELAPEFQDAIDSVVPNPLGLFTGVTLDLRPLLAASQVELDVRFASHVVSFLRSVPATVGGEAVDVEIPVYRPSTDRVFLFVPDGQTIVIGGLLRDGAAVPEKGIPLLRDLPVDPQLRQKTNENQTLLLLVTPRIVDSD